MSTTLHKSTFEYLKPTDEQMRAMDNVRGAFSSFVSYLDKELPAGPDKTFVLRNLRDCAMWANVAITRTRRRS
jgi:hypothetical protein